MQRSEVTVRLAGDMNNTVNLSKVSPAEIVILRTIHGEDAIVNVRPVFMDKEPHQIERNRLAYKYGAAVVDECFPGKLNQLPVTLKDIALEVPASDEFTDDPVPAVAPKYELGPDDHALIELVKAAKSKSDLHALAEQNEVDLADVPDRMDDIREAIVNRLFPNYAL